MSTAMASGLLSMALPGKSGEGQKLEDFVTDKRVQRMSPYGTFANIWELAGDDPDDEIRVGSNMKHPPSCPDLAC